MTRHTLVSGAASGIGRAVAMRLAADGVVVTLLDRSEDALRPVVEEIDRLGGRGYAQRCDVSSEEEVEAAVRMAAERNLPPATGLVHAAGISDFCDFVDLDLRRWQTMLDVHLTGGFLLAKAVMPSMIDAGFGRVVIVASTAAMSGSARHVHYAAAKAGLLGFARALAKEAGPHGVTVNVVAPGLIDTPMMSTSPPEVRARYTNPVGRIGLPDDIAAAVHHLHARDSSFVNGACLVVDGGAL